MEDKQRLRKEIQRFQEIQDHGNIQAPLNNLQPTFVCEALTSARLMDSSGNLK